MPGEVISQKFFNQNRNGLDFAGNPTDYETFPQYNYGDLARLVTRVAFFAKAEASDADIFTWDKIARTITRANPNSSFVLDGFVAGDEITIAYSSGTGQQDGVSFILDSVTDSTMILAAGPTISPSNFYSTLVIWKTTPLKSITFEYNWDENNNPGTSYISALNGKTHGYTFLQVGPGSPRSTSPVQGVWNETDLAHKSGTINCSYVQTEGFKQYFDIVHTWEVGSPAATTLEGANIVANNKPSWLNGTLTQKAVFRCLATDQNNNPNASLIAVSSNTLGDIGGWAENFNGGAPEYTPTGSTFLNVSDLSSVTAIQVGHATRVTATVDSANSRFINGQNVVLYHSCIPSQANQIVATNTMNTNFMLDRVVQQINDPAIDGTVITNFTATLITASQIQLVFDVEYTTAQQALLTAANRYVLSIACEDRLQEHSDRVSVPISIDNYLHNTDIAGLYDIEDAFYYDHPENLGTNGATDYNGCVEDGFVYQFDFWVEQAATIKTLELDFGLNNPAAPDAEQWYSVDVRNFDFTSNQLVLPSGSQFILTNATQGYNSPAGDQFNLVRITTGAVVGTKQYYQCTLGLKVDYRDWEALTAPAAFIDTTDTNNGLHRKLSKYDGVSGYQVRFKHTAVVEKDSVNTTYTHWGPAFSIRDYDESNNWIAALGTITDSGTAIPGYYSEDEPTKLVATFTLLSGTVTEPVADIDCVQRLNKLQGSRLTLQELSSRLGHPTTNYLVPLANETLLQKVVSGATIIASGQIDHNNLPANSGTLTASARIWYPSCQPTAITTQWVDDMWTSYTTIHSHLTFSAAFEARFRAVMAPCLYYNNTFGPDGRNHTACDFVLFFEYDNHVISRPNSKTGAVLRWDFQDTIYDQNDLPAHTHTSPGATHYIGVSSVDGFDNITAWRMQGNNLLGGFPKLSMATLDVLDIDNNDFNQAWAAHDTPVIRNMKLSRNHFAGAFPLHTYASIISIVANNNEFTSLPAWTSTQLPTVQQIDFASNLLTGTLVDWNMSTVHTITLGNNLFSGTAPLYSAQTGMITLELFNNPSLGGTVPTWSFASLLTLRIENCSFTGELPSGIDTPLIRVFKCNDNSGLNGVLPNYSWASIDVYDISACAFSGAMPTLTGLSNVRIFYADDNNFTSIPVQTFPNCTDFDIGEITAGTTINNHVLVNAEFFRADGGNYTTLTASTLIQQSFRVFDVGNNALTVAAIDAILAEFVVGIGSRPASMVITLNSGTNGIPTGGATNADLLTIQANGHTVTFNT